MVVTREQTEDIQHRLDWCNFCEPTGVGAINAYPKWPFIIIEHSAWNSCLHLECGCRKITINILLYYCIYDKGMNNKYEMVDFTNGYVWSIAVSYLPACFTAKSL